MTLLNFPLDTGPEGAAITLANTGATLINYTDSGGGTGTYLAAAKAYGSYGVRLAMNPGKVATFRFAFNAPNNQVSVRFATSCLKEVESDIGGNAAPMFVAFRDSDDTGTVCSLRFLKDQGGKIQFVVGGAGALMTEFTPASVTAMYRYAIIVNNLTGAWSLKVYDVDDTTVIHSDSGTTNFNIKTPMQTFQLGGGLSIASTQDVDYVQINDGSNTEIPSPSSATPAPISAVGYQTVPSGSTAKVRTTISSGSVASYAWTVLYPTASPPILTGASTDTVSFTAPAPGSLVILKCVATYSNNTTASVVTEVRVPSTSNQVRALADLSSGDDWQIIGGASTLEAALGDNNSATMVESPDITASPKVRRFRLAPMAARSDLTINLGGVMRTDTTATNCKIRVGYGSTQIKEFSLGETTTAQDKTLTLTANEVASIADWGNVWLELVTVL